MERIKFGVVGMFLAALIHLMLQAIVGQIESGSGWGYVLVYWRYGYCFASLWLSSILTIAFRFRPWVAFTVGSGLFVLDLLRPAVSNPSRLVSEEYWQGQWMGARIVLFAVLLGVPMLWLAMTGRRRDWRLESIKEVSEWFRRESRKV